jgi:MoxR-like ATPase
MTDPSLFTELRQVLEREHICRHDAIEAVLLALVSGGSLLFVGPPGVAKSQLIRRTLARVADAELFDTSLDMFSTPEDLYGPHSLAAMREDRWEREIQGTLLTADVAMLDEFFEASSALLKALLRVLREGTYRHGTTINSVNLLALFAATNTVPTDPRLAALYDRLLIRCHVQRIGHASDFVAMLNLGAPEPDPSPIVSRQDLVEAQRDSARVFVPVDVFEAMASMRRDLDAEGINVTDRRFVEALRCVRASAWLGGQEKATLDDLHCLRYVLWDRPEQIMAVTAIVESTCEPRLKELSLLASDIHTVYESIIRDLPSIERKALAAEVHRKLKDARGALQGIVDSLGPTSSRAVWRRATVVADELSRASDAALTDLLELDPAEVSNLAGYRVSIQQ